MYAKGENEKQKIAYGEESKYGITRTGKNVFSTGGEGGMQVPNPPNINSCTKT